MRRPVAIIAAVGALSSIVMVLLDMEPRLVLVGLLVTWMACAAWLFFDLALVAAPVSWNDGDTMNASGARSDRRVQLLTSRLRQSKRRSRPGMPSDDSHPSDEVSNALVALIDDHLEAVHGIDRLTDPGPAATVLGPDLTRFVNDLTERRAMVQRRTLARTVASIETFITAST